MRGLSVHTYVLAQLLYCLIYRHVQTGSQQSVIAKKAKKKGEYVCVCGCVD